MPTLFILLLYLHDPDVNALASEDYQTRHAAFVRLDHAGVLAMPSVARVLDSDDPDVKRSAERLAEPFLCDLRADGRRAVVLWLVYAPSDGIGWEELKRDAWALEWVEDAVSEYAQSCGYITEADREAYYTAPFRLFWRGEHFTCWLQRIRATAR